MLNLERLRTLDALARLGSVSGAAEGLHVTTSAVSQQLAKLEREVGQRLLARNGRGVRLTDAGRLLADHAARILSQVELAQADIEAQSGQVVGEVRIGGFPTAARGLFPAALARLRADHPDLRVRTQELEPERGVRGVVRGDLDLAVVLDWSNRRLPVPGGLAQTHLLDDSADIAMPAGHPLAGRADVELAEFADDEWISWPEGEFCHEWLMFTLRSQGIEPRIGHLAAEHHTQLALIAAGLGVCVAPRLGRGPVPEGVAVVPVRSGMRRHVYAVWRTDAERRPSLRAAVAAMRQAVRDQSLLERAPAGSSAEERGTGGGSLRPGAGRSPVR
ncbi:LysR family transcriptional regulator [Streptomyces clavuligerus]|uniref:Putative LysR-family transcriptional regulator n=1 Tax=Streptomyces clavuligerus TaxID=1901 RepID=B5GZ11_STRCL|nr:LysR family transcriptional regulator [Streptomyces clavuligerus]ANW21220.1 LysR family transcriptional regulator [Streptomyces clavuligerus]AXU15845.1 LysR family transcriptional regulator [Streptomyces clavuligerus]EDY51557.1 LysR-family transcriptional regulator [Streptomyces clavuligerus]EFG05670.1 Putative LysR-family transcriptional regulator [Streptomyces clavuligerus]MBY6305968.1 LysR family transcriptional regulator [Streptomyces clavuligerus]